MDLRPSALPMLAAGLDELASADGLIPYWLSRAATGARPFLGPTNRF
jgi:hypothetical protein